MQTVSPPPHVNYVALSPTTSASDDLDPVVDMVISSIGFLELDLLTPIDPRHGVLPESVSSIK
jgi:hypothetical protein